MIDRAYCRRMARYNAWQNRLLWDTLEPIERGALTEALPMQHGSLLGALNHLLWLDRMWLSRLYRIAPPDTGLADSVRLHADGHGWWTDRFRTDGALRMWADTLNSVDLMDQIAFWSISLEEDIILSKAECVMHMFNQQTDQRAVIRSHLAARGMTLPPVNLFQMPTS